MLSIFFINFSGHVVKLAIDHIYFRFVEKVIEFLCLVASAHFHRLDEATAKAFMTLLLPFTFQQEESGFYYDCLEIWARLLDHLNAQIPILNFSSPSREDFLSQIKQPIMGLATGIIHSNAKFNSVYDDFFPHEVNYQFFRAWSMIE